MSTKWIGFEHSPIKYTNCIKLIIKGVFLMKDKEKINNII